MCRRQGWFFTSAVQAQSSGLGMAGLPFLPWMKAGELKGGGRMCVKAGTSILYAATFKRASGQKSICILLRSELWGLYQNPTICCGL